MCYFPQPDNGNARSKRVVNKQVSVTTLEPPNIKESCRGDRILNDKVVGCSV
jgi:hypothetical protein